MGTVVILSNSHLCNIACIIVSNNLFCYWFCFTVENLVLGPYFVRQLKKKRKRFEAKELSLHFPVFISLKYHWLSCIWNDNPRFLFFLSVLFCFYDSHLCFLISPFLFSCRVVACCKQNGQVVFFLLCPLLYISNTSFRMNSDVRNYCVWMVSWSYIWRTDWKDKHNVVKHTWRRVFTAICVCWSGN